LILEITYCVLTWSILKKLSREVWKFQQSCYWTTLFFFFYLYELIWWTMVTVLSIKCINEILMLCYCYWNFRQSIDLYSSVPSPSIGFLGNSSLTRLSSSFLSTSLTRRHTPEVLPSVTKPLIQPTEEEKHQRRSSHTLLPPLSRRSSLLKKESKVSHEVPSRHCSFGQAVLNGKLLNLRLYLLYCMIYGWKCVYKGSYCRTNRFCIVELDSIHILWGGCYRFSSIFTKLLNIFPD